MVYSKFRLLLQYDKSVGVERCQLSFIEVQTLA